MISPKKAVKEKRLGEFIAKRADAATDGRAAVYQVPEKTSSNQEKAESIESLKAEIEELKDSLMDAMVETKLSWGHRISDICSIIGANFGSPEDIDRLLVSEIDKHLSYHLSHMSDISLRQAGRIAGVKPIRCDNSDNHMPLYPSWDGEKVILICRDCDYSKDTFPTW